jgi:hypothetical protein
VERAGGRMVGERNGQKKRPLVSRSLPDFFHYPVNLSNIIVMVVGYVRKP